MKKFLKYSFVFLVSIFSFNGCFSAQPIQSKESISREDVSLERSLKQLVFNALKKQQESSAESSHDTFDKTMQLAKRAYNLDQILLQKKISEAMLKRLNGTENKSLFASKIKQGLGNAVMLAAEWTTAIVLMIIVLKAGIKLAPSLIIGGLSDAFSIFNPVKSLFRYVKNSIQNFSITGWIKQSAPVKVFGALGRVIKKVVTRNHS